MLTRQGWIVGLLGLAFVLAGRLLGPLELYLVGGTLLALVVTAVAYTNLLRLNIGVERELHPPKVHAGSPSRVDLKVENKARRRTPVLGLRDAVSGTQGANLLVGPLDSGAVVRAAYRLPTERRGILKIGPLDVLLSDPIGLTETRLRASGVSELTVFPHVDTIAPVPQTTGSDPMAGAEHPNALGRSGEDFYALRTYVVGDDLRRVHWPSTARHDDLMVRQDELPWQGRATVLLDVRRATVSPAALELAVSAAASIVNASARRQDLIRLVTTDGTDSGFAALIAVLPELVQEERDRLVRVRRRFGSLTLVQIDRSAWDHQARAQATTASTRAPDGMLHVSASQSFAAAWNGSMRPRRSYARPLAVTQTAAVTPPTGPIQPGGQNDDERWYRARRLRG